LSLLAQRAGCARQDAISPLSSDVTVPWRHLLATETAFRLGNPGWRKGCVLGGYSENGLRVERPPWRLWLGRRDVGPVWPDSGHSSGWGHGL